MSRIDAATLAATDGLEVVGPDHWRYAQVKDWILLCGDIPHVDVRVYAVFRSLAAQAPRGRRLSKDEVRWLVPGVNGKAMSMRTLEESLRRLSATGLVVAEQGNVNTRATRNRQGRWERVEALLWRVRELPTEGMGYQGWHTVQDGLDAYPGPGWEDRVAVRPTDTPDPSDGEPGTDTSTVDTPGPSPDDQPGAAAGDNADRARKSAPRRTRSDQRKRANTAGGTARGATRKSAQPARKSADRARKSSDDTPSDVREPDAPNLSTNLSTDQPPQSPPDAPPSEGTDTGGLAGGEPPRDLETTARAARLITDLTVPSGASPPNGKQRAALVDLVCRLWDLGASSREIRDTATRGTDDVRHAGAVWIRRLTDRIAYHEARRPNAPVTGEHAAPGPPPPAPVPDDAPARVAARQAARPARYVHRNPKPRIPGRKKTA